MKRLALHLTVWLFVGAVLLGVLALYLQPLFMVNMANQLWGCF